MGFAEVAVSQSAEETARLVTLFLADPMARLPSFVRMGATEYPFAVAVKTGTSSNFRDAWTVAWSGKWLLGVWVGHPDVRPMNRLTGYRSAALLARDILGKLHARQMQGLDDLSFPPPRAFGKEPMDDGGRVPAEVEGVVRQCLAKDAAERFADAKALMQALESCAAHVRLAGRSASSSRSAASPLSTRSTRPGPRRQASRACRPSPAAAPTSSGRPRRRIRPRGHGAELRAPWPRAHPAHLRSLRHLTA